VGAATAALLLRTRPVRTALAVAPVVTLVLAVGILLERSSARAAPGWTTVVAGLSAARAAAFAHPARDPDGFDLPGSPAWRQDRAALDRLKASGVTYAHLAITVTDVQVVAESESRATLRVAVGTSAYDVVGGPAHREPQRPAREVLLSLRRVADGWRVIAVDAAAQPSRTQ
jgi:hypothetical protein